MPYKISSLYVKNFKCFDNDKFYEFKIIENRNPIILSGPNGFGKTTFFDAIELIFTGKVTRLCTSIENGKTDLGRNILLNRPDNDGILVLNLINDDNDTISIVAKIDQNNKKLKDGATKEAISYSFSNNALNSESCILDFLGTQLNWSSSLNDCLTLKYFSEDFNVYYYVSQAESVHFLKRDMKNRKSSVDSLLNLGDVETYISRLNNLIGATKKSSKVLINDAISECENSIEKQASDIIRMRNEVNISAELEVYNQLLSYPQQVPAFLWDVKNSIFNENSTQSNLNRYIEQIDALHCFAISKDDYTSYVKNESLERLIRSKTAISDFINYYKFIENGLLNVLKLQEDIAINETKRDVYNHCRFFRESFNLSLYKKDDLLKLQKLNPVLLKTNIDEITIRVNEILELNKEISSDQTLLSKLQQSRQVLHQHSMSLGESCCCPYCNYQYDNHQELENQFSILTAELNSRKSNKSEKVENLTAEINSMLEISKQDILNYLGDLDSQSIDTFSNYLQNAKTFINDTGRINYVNEIYKYMNSDESWLELDYESQAREIQHILSARRIAYKNAEFMSMFEKYSFSKIATEYKGLFSLEQSKLINIEEVERKKTFLKQEYSMSKSSKLKDLEKQLREDIVKKQKLNTLRSKLAELMKIYNKTKDEYKTQIVKRLRVPLLIYSGKILQDYQNGLGVFIDEDMRFVANGDAKHDILNTFSSGQLSGFVLSFLFAMNRQYINKTDDDIGFILIDDPVQTMDDINIASLIEVLRNDFPDKQIVLSTHETDKENYILYKFLKYNQKGQSFNVKEQLYQ